MDRLIILLVVIALLAGSCVWFFGAPEREAQRQHEAFLEHQRQVHDEQLARDFDAALATIGGVVAIGIAGIVGIVTLGALGYAVIALISTVVAMIGKLVPRTVNYTTTNNNILVAPPPQPKHQAVLAAEEYLKITDGVRRSLLPVNRRED